jgi:hypothetical protein
MAADSRAHCAPKLLGVIDRVAQGSRGMISENHVAFVLSLAEWLVYPSSMQRLGVKNACFI